MFSVCGTHPGSLSRTIFIIVSNCASGGRYSSPSAAVQCSTYYASGACIGWYNKTLPVLLSSKLACHSNSSLVKVRARQFLQKQVYFSGVFGYFLILSTNVLCFVLQMTLGILSIVASALHLQSQL